MTEDTSKISKKALKRKLKTKNKDGNRLQCQYILKHKAGKQCNMTRRKDEQFCAQHILLVKDSVGGRKRVPCPLDKGHSVWEDQLEHHLEKCQAKPKVPTEKWYSLNMNIVDGTDTGVTKPEDIDFKKWIPVLTELYEREVKDWPVSRDVRQNEGLNERLSELENKKHAIQQSSLIGHMADNNLLQDSDNKADTLIIEFGCGRAELSRYIYRSQLLDHSQRIKNDDQAVPRNKFLFIDRSNPRMKLDCKLVEDYHQILKEQGIEDGNNDKIFSPEYSRLKIDIKDLDLDKSPFVSQVSEESRLKVTAVSKHLCGCATDLTLACLKNSHLMSPHNPAALQGIVIALCCRQLCSYETYPLSGRKWLEANNITREGFRAISRLTSWAVCGTRGKKDGSIESSTRMDEQERERVGLMARRIIDFGRVKSLQELGYNAQIVEYVDKSISLENHCLVVTGIH